MGVHTALWESDFISFGRRLRSRVAGLHGTSSIFNFLRHLHTIFHNGSMNLHPHHSAQRGPFLLILANRARAALPCSAHQPLSLHLLTRNTLLRIRWSVSLLNESTKDNTLSLVFANTHSWMCFSTRSQHSSHTNPRDSLSSQVGVGGRWFLDSLTSRRPLPAERLPWHCGGLSSAGTGAARRGSGVRIAQGDGRCGPEPGLA